MIKNQISTIEKHLPKKQIDILWSLKDDKYYLVILIMIYTGVRIDELLSLKKENIHLEEHYFDVIKSKTENGPISDYIYPLI